MSNKPKDSFDVAPDKLELKGRPTGLSVFSKRMKLIILIFGLVAIGLLTMATVANWRGDSVPVDGAQASQSEADKDQRKQGIKTADFSQGTETVPDGQSTSALGAASFDTGAGLAAGAVVPSMAGATLNEGPGLGPGAKIPSVGAIPSAGVANTGRPSPMSGGKPGNQQALGLDASAIGNTPEFASDRQRAIEQSKQTAKNASPDVGTWTVLNQPRDESQGVRDKLADSLKTLTAAATGASAGAASNQQQDDQNKQLRKEAFLRAAEAVSDKTNLMEVRRMPLSKYVITAGASIPVALGCGVNTDLPGQICARTTQNVYDSKTGQCLLIPQGTMVIGAADNQVALGQERILSVWNTMIFEDSSTMNLRGMPGADIRGTPGFDAEVNNHYGKVVLIAGVASIFSAGLQLSQPNNGNGTTVAPSVGQTIAGTIGQQIGQTGMQTTQKQLQVQPTLSRDRGYPFVIQVTSNIVFDRPYRGKCG